MQSRHIAILVIVIAITAVVAGFIITIQMPDVKVSGVEIANITPTDLTLNITLEIHNPNFFSVPIGRIVSNVTYLHSGGWEPLSDAHMDAFEITGGDTKVTIPVHAKNANLIRAGFSLLIDREITIQVEGTIEPSLLLYTPKIPFSEVKTISI